MCNTNFCGSIIYRGIKKIHQSYLTKSLKEYEFIEVYHFTSSVSLHLKQMSNILVKGIPIPFYEQRQNKLRKLACEFIHVPLGW